MLYYSCSPHWEASSVIHSAYNWFLIFLGFMVPTFLIVGSNVLIMKKLFKVNIKTSINTKRDKYTKNSFSQRFGHVYFPLKAQKESITEAKTML